MLLVSLLILIIFLTIILIVVVNNDKSAIIRNITTINIYVINISSFYFIITHTKYYNNFLLV